MPVDQNGFWNDDEVAADPMIEAINKPVSKPSPAPIAATPVKAEADAEVYSWPHDFESLAALWGELSKAARLRDDVAEAKRQRKLKACRLELFSRQQTPDAPPMHANDLAKAQLARERTIADLAEKLTAAR
jgi:hypothetical protein